MNSGTIVTAITITIGTKRCTNSVTARSRSSPAPRGRSFVFSTR
jgi:hypothetical protein